MKFQAFHVNPGEKLKKKDVNNDLSNFMSVFPIMGICTILYIFETGNYIYLSFHFNHTSLLV